MPTATLTRDITLEIHICDQRRSYRVTWEGPDAEERCLAYLSTRGSTHAWGELEESPIDFGTAEEPRFPKLYDLLYPTCSHGLDANNCYGPQHYYYDDEEQARGMLNSGAW